MPMKRDSKTNNCGSSSFRSMLFLLLALLLCANGASAKEIYGSVNASEIQDGVEVILKGDATIFMDVNKTIKRINGETYSLTINGGNILTINNSEAVGIVCKNLTINAPVYITTSKSAVRCHGVLSVNAGLKAICYDTGYALWAENGIDINTGKQILLEAGPNGQNSHCIMSETGNVSIAACEMEITASANGCYGILADKGSVSLNPKSLELHAYYGIKASDDITLKGPNTLIYSTATAVQSDKSIIIKDGTVSSSCNTGCALEAVTGITIDAASLEAKTTQPASGNYAIYCSSGDITISNSSVSAEAKGSNAIGLFAEGTIFLSGSSSITIPSGGSIKGHTIVDGGGTTAKLVHISQPSISGQVALSGSPFVGQEVGVTLSGGVASLAEIIYQWQKSDTGEAWSDISGATGSTYTPNVSDYRDYIRVMVKAKETTGWLTSEMRLVDKVACKLPLDEAPELTISGDNHVLVTNAKAAQEYVILKATTFLNESDWAYALSPSSDGTLDMGGEMNNAYFVYTRVEETNTTKAGTDVERSLISLGEDPNFITGIVMKATLLEMNGISPYFFPIDKKDNSGYYVKKDDVIRIQVSQVPSGAGFDGIKGSEWGNPKNGGTFYAYYQCDTPLESDQPYKTVYYKAEKQMSYNEITAQFTRSDSQVLSDKLTLQVANADGVWLIDDITLDEDGVTIGMGETLTGIDFPTLPLQASLKDIYNYIDDVNSSTGVNPTISFDDATHTMTVDATNATIGTYYFDIYQIGRGSRVPHKVKVNVTGIPCEGITIEPATLEIEPGETVSLSAQLQPANSTYPVKWSSSNSSYVSVTDGVVSVDASTPRGSTYTITATAGEQSAEMTVNIPKLPAELSFGNYEPTVYVGADFTPPTLTNPHGLTMVYSSSDENVATVNSSTGEVTIVGKGMATITASTIGDDNYAADDISYNIMAQRHTADLAFNEPTAWAKIGTAFTPPTLSNPYKLTLTWTSSDKTAATVNASTGEVTIVAPGATTITATFAGDKAYIEGTASYALTIGKGEASLSFPETSASAKMGEDFTPPTLTNPNNLTVTWKSSNETVATVDPNTGTVTLVGPGNIFITAEFAGNDYFEAGSASYDLTIEKADPVANGLAFSEDKATAKMGEDFTPPTLTNPNNLTVTWKSGNETVATVDPNTGEVTLVGPGSVSITAEFAGNDDFLEGTVSYALTVEKADPVANGLALSDDKATAKMGEDFTPPTLTNPNNLNVTWKSSLESVAAVNITTGEVTLIAAGTTTITATFDGNDDFLAGSVAYELTVEKADPVANGLAFLEDKATAKMGEDFTLPTLTNPNNLTVTWTSSDKTVATVDPNTGTVTLIAAGTTTITATFDGDDDFLAGSVVYELTVEKADPVANGLAFSEDEATAIIGEDFTPPTLINPNDLTVIWSSTEETVATVDPKTGEVTLVGPGTITIQAEFEGNDDFLDGIVFYMLTVKEAEIVVLKGDANEDGVVDDKDIEVIVNYIINNEADFNFKNADMNDDGVINATDIVYIVTKINE